LSFHSVNTGQNLPNIESEETTKMKILAEIEQIQDEMIAIRHAIHAHPELGFEEFATSDLVAQKLEEWGFEVHRGLAGTGVDIFNLLQSGT